VAKSSHAELKGPRSVVRPAWMEVFDPPIISGIYGKSSGNTQKNMIFSRKYVFDFL
jgi:hypothetical protein